MKKIFLLISVTITLTTNAQWSGPTSGVLSTSNTVQISRSFLPTCSPNPCPPTPLFSLQVTGAGPNNNQTLFPLYVNNNAYVGVGTNTPISLFHIDGGNFTITRNSSQQVFQLLNGGTMRLTHTVNHSSRGFFINNGVSDYFMVNQSGIVFKDQSQDLFKVNIDGYAYARKMVVTLANPFPDYVFSKNYKLMPLTDLAAFIKQNKHLPNIPSAQQVADNNNQVELGEMQTKLLEKVEELTLYILQQQQQIDELKRILAEQQ